MHNIGDTVWMFDSSHRVYKRNIDGRAMGGPIFREHFRPALIIGETAKSWVLDASGLKVPKMGGDVRYCGSGPYGKRAVFMTQAAVDAACFRNGHQYKISKAVETCTDVAVLRQIAALVGYKAEE